MNRETKAAADERWAAEQALQRREAMDRERDASRAAVAQAEAEERAKAAALADAEAEAARIAAERKREERQAEHRKKTEEQEKARADAARKRAALAELQRRAKAGDKGAAATLRALNAAEAKRRDEALAAQHAVAGERTQAQNTKKARKIRAEVQSRATARHTVHAHRVPRRGVEPLWTG